MVALIYLEKSEHPARFAVVIEVIVFFDVGVSPAGDVYYHFSRFPEAGFSWKSRSVIAAIPFELRLVVGTFAPRNAKIYLTLLPNPG